MAGDVGVERKREQVAAGLAKLIALEEEKQKRESTLAKKQKTLKWWVSRVKTPISAALIEKGPHEMGEIF